MKRGAKRPPKRAGLARAGRFLVPALSVCMVLGSCGQRLPDPGRGDRNGNGVVSLRVQVTAGNLGTPTNRIPFSAMGAPFTLRIEALGADGQVLTGFNDFVSLNVSPGVLQSITGGNVQGRLVQLNEGAAEPVIVTLSRSYGEARFTVEDTGYFPVPPDSSAPGCADGLDNDNDGLFDFPADYGCAAPNDDSETGGSYALAASEPIYFQQPSIHDVQGEGRDSPLVNERVSIDRGTLIVTRISISGFWVTDIADRSCTAMDGSMVPCYNSIFAFNFRLPEGLRPCDRLERLVGTVGEFVSTTQFSQPSWSIAPGGMWIDETTSGACPIPDATVVTGSMLGNDNAFEKLESGLVRASGLVFPQNVGPAKPVCTPSGVTYTCAFTDGASNCDMNDDGVIVYDSTTPEGACASACQVTRGCSEWSNWKRFGQVSVDFMGTQTAGENRLVINPKDVITGFNPETLQTTPITVTGTLKQVGPSWIIEPRCTQDVLLDGSTPPPARQTCLFPRSETEDP